MENDFLGILANMFGPNAAQAAGALGPNGVPQGMPTEQQLLNSAPAALPQAGFPPPIEPPGSVVNPRSVTAAPVVPTAAAAPAVEPDVMAPGAVGAAFQTQPDATRLEARAPAVGAEGPVAPSPADAQASAGAGRPSLAQALKGTTGIKPPELQRLSTPNAPRATGTIKGGELMALLQAINAGGGAPARPVRLGG